MTGLPGYNYPAFNTAAKRLRELGYEVENPAENPEPHCGTWLGYMRMAIRQLALCDGLVLLPGWQDSRGARIEQQLAAELRLMIVRECTIQRGPEATNSDNQYWIEQ